MGTYKYVGQNNCELTHGKMYRCVVDERGHLRFHDDHGMEICCYPDNFVLVQNVPVNESTVKGLYDQVDFVTFNKKKRTTFIKFKDGSEQKATASKDTPYNELQGFYAAYMKHHFGKVEDIMKFIERKRK